MGKETPAQERFEDVLARGKEFIVEAAGVDLWKKRFNSWGLDDRLRRAADLSSKEIFSTISIVMEKYIESKMTAPSLLTILL